MIFFAKDGLQRENTELEHCSANKIVDDFNMKSLQEFFYEQSDMIMGKDDASLEGHVEEKRPNNFNTRKRQNKHDTVRYRTSTGTGNVIFKRTVV